jgi:hypothetical protein
VIHPVEEQALRDRLFYLLEHIDRVPRHLRSRVQTMRGSLRYGFTVIRKRELERIERMSGLGHKEA